MSGVIKLGNVTLGTENSGKVDLTNLNTVALGSKTVLSQNSGKVDLTNLNTVALGSKTVLSHNTTTNVVTLGITTVASYTWGSFNASASDGTVTNAPSTGTTVNNDYVSLVNSNGTVTATFAIAGSYFVSISYWVAHSNTYVYDTVYLQLSGGTAATNTNNTTVDDWGSSSQNGNMIGNYSFVTTPTVNQTLQILPKYRVSASDSTQHTVNALVNIIYCGS